MAVAAAAQASVALSTTEGFRLPSRPTALLASKPSLSIPTAHRLRLSSSRSPPFLPPQTTPRLVRLVASTSEWAHLVEEAERLSTEDELLESEDLGDWQGEEDDEAVAAPMAGISERKGKCYQEGAADGDGGSAQGEGETYAEAPEGVRLLVTNIPYDVDAEQLAQLFQYAGSVEIVEVTQQSRGFGYVTMSTVEEADKALEMFHHYDLDGRLLGVRKAFPRGSPVERSPPDFQPSFTIYVSNLPWRVDQAQLEQMFSEHGQVLQAKVMRGRRIGHSLGYGYVTMASQAGMEDAIAALNGQEFGGRLLVVKRRLPRGTPAERSPPDVRPPFMIHVSNLPWQVGEARLEQIFTEHGKVLQAKVMRDRHTGHSRGYGFVRMASQAGMEDAVAALNEQNLYGRRLKVSVARRGHRVPPPDEETLQHFIFHSSSTVQ